MNTYLHVHEGSYMIVLLLLYKKVMKILLEMQAGNHLWAL
jgi:hypothetical protein